MHTDIHIKHLLHKHRYDNYAKRRVLGHKMGIISNVKVFHKQDLTKTNRTDNTNPDEKWKALVLQERYYQTHFLVTLHKYRETMDLRNTSWNGAVVSYLKVPQDRPGAEERRRERERRKRKKEKKRVRGTKGYEYQY